MDSYGSGMGIIWETSHKGVPLLGVLENPTDLTYQVQQNGFGLRLGLEPGDLLLFWYLRLFRGC